MSDFHEQMLAWSREQAKTNPYNASYAFQCDPENIGTANLTWKLTYVGIPIELSYWGYGHMNNGAGMWNYYIYIHKEMVTDAQWEALIGDTENYCSDSLAQVDFHGGITYSKLATETCLKVGCDFGHYWDSERNYPYSFKYVKSQAENSAQMFAQSFGPKIRSSYDGKYYPRWLLKEINPGVFYTQANIDASNEWNIKNGLPARKYD